MIEIKVHNQTSQTLKLWDFQRGKKEKKKITLNQKIHVYTKHKHKQTLLLFDGLERKMHGNQEKNPIPQTSHRNKRLLY